MFWVSAKSGKFHYYVCATSYRTGKDACGVKAVPQSLIEELVLVKIRQLVLRKEHIKELVSLTNEELKSSLGQVKERTRGLDAQLKDLEQRLERLYEVLEAWKLALDDLAPRIRDLRGKQDLLLRAKAEAHETLDAGRVELVSRKVVLEYLKDLKEVLEQGST